MYGVFESEIATVTISSRKGDIVVSEDEGPSKVKFDKIPSLRPAFEKDVLDQKNLDFYG